MGHHPNLVSFDKCGTDQKKYSTFVGHILSIFIEWAWVWIQFPVSCWGHCGKINLTKRWGEPQSFFLPIRDFSNRHRMRPIVEPTGKAHAVSTWRLDPLSLKFFLRGTITYERTLPFGRDITMPQGRSKNTAISFRFKNNEKACHFRIWLCIMCIYKLLKIIVVKRMASLPCPLLPDWDAALHPSPELFQRHGGQRARHSEGWQERRIRRQFRDDDTATFASFGIC